MLEFLGKLWRLASPHRWRLILGVLAGLVAGLMDPILLCTVALVYKVLFEHTSAQEATYAIDKARQYLPGGWIDGLQNWLSTHWPSQQALEPQGFLAVVVIFLIPTVMLLRGVAGYLNVYLMTWVAVRSISDLRSRLFEHLLRLPASFFNRTSTGELMSRIGDVSVLQNGIAVTLSVIIKEPATLLCLLAAALWKYRALTLVSLLVFPVSIIPIVLYSRKVRRSSRTVQTLAAELAKIQHETFTGNRIIKAYNMEEVVVRQFKERIRSVVSHTMRISRSAELPGPLIEFIGSIGVTILFIYLVFVPNSHPSGPGFLAFVLGIFSMYRPVKTIVRLHSQLEQAKAASERVFQLLATQSDISDPPHPQKLAAAGADIRFEGIHFKFGEKPVLNGINLTVKSGQMVALVGLSGAGKTTLTNLLLRFYDPTGGVVRIGDTDIRNVTLRDLRSQIAVVTQETVLFDDTIRHNIEIGRPGATDAEIEDAARHAKALDFILEKPGGMLAMIGEKGVSLSGGQRQRLAIARAIVRDAPILVLDEATNSLDPESQRAVQAALEDLMQGRTTICIAHRLSTVQRADVIVVMEAGRIVEMGKHDELLSKGGAYQRLYTHELPE
jgi:subfamily B ATP-binding cassette protein MsbA